MTKNQSIKLTDNITLELGKNKPFNLVAIEVILILIATIGCTLIASETLSLQITLPVALSMFCFPIVFGLLFSLKFSIKSVLIQIAIVTLGVLFFINEIIDGLRIVNGNFIVGINKYYGLNLLYTYKFHTDSVYNRVVTLFSVFAIIAISMLLTIIIVRLKSPLIQAVIFAPFIFLSINLSGQTLLLPLVFFLFSFLGLYAIRCLDVSPRGRVIYNSQFKRKLKSKTSFFYERHILDKVKFASVITITSFALAVIICVTALYPSMEYSLGDNARNTGKKIIELASTINVDKAVDLFNELGFSFRNNVTLPKATAGISNGGKLGATGKNSFTGETQLLIKTDKPVPMYLKGFVGEKYDNARWDTFGNKEYKKYEQMLSQMETVGIPPNYIADNFFRFLGHDDVFKLQNETNDKNIESELSESLSFIEHNLTTAKTQIQNVSTMDKNYYIPYMLKSTEFSQSAKYENDTTISKKGVGNKTYVAESYAIYSPGNENYYSPPLLWSSIESLNLDNDALFSQIDVPEFNDARVLESTDYRKMVEKLYCDVPKNVLTPQFEYVVDVIKTNTTYYNNDVVRRAELVDSVIRYLSVSTQYSLSPGVTPNDKEFVNYFLFENQRGYCSYYATAATMLLRAMDVPTRYVEGYIVTANDYVGVDLENDTVQIKDTNSHAWIEVYINNLGWIPFEVTPSYSGQAIPDVNDDHNSALPKDMQIEEFDQDAKSTSTITPSSTVTSTPTPSDDASNEVSSPSNALAQSDATTSQIMSGINDKSEQGLNERFEKKTSPLKPYLLSLGLLLVITAVVFARRTFIILLRNHMLTKQSNEKCVISAYKHLLNVISFLGYKITDFDNDQEFAKTVCKNCKLDSIGDLMNIVDLACEVRFSDHNVPVSAKTRIVAFAKTISSEAYAELNWIGKIKFKLVYAFI